MLGDHMSKKTKKHIKRLKHSLQILAFLSLIADTAISILTFISLEIGKKYVIDMLFMVNYVLSGIVIASVALFITLGIVYHYEKVLKLMRRKQLARRAEQKAAYRDSKHVNG